MDQSGSVYSYTKLHELPEDGRVYVYGLVRSISDSDFVGQLIEIQDEDTTALVKVAKGSSKYFNDLQVGDILRLHRAEIGSHQNNPVLLVDIHKFGCHAVAWRGQSDVPHIVTSRNYTSTETDLSRVAALRKLNTTQDDEAEAGTSAWRLQERDSGEGSPVNTVSDRPVVAEPAPSRSPARKKLRSSDNIVNALDIPKLGNKFFNWYAQVLGVYKGKGEPFTVFLRVWDGTKPKFPPYRNMFHADKNSIDTVYCEVSPQFHSIIETSVVDVCCYGDWAKKALSLQVNDVVHLCNIRNYTSLTNGMSAVTMHEGGLQFGRELEVVDESDPKHFEISKQCADTLSRILGSTEPQSSSSVVNMTPTLPENVLAQSTPVFSKNDATLAVGECGGRGLQELPANLSNYQDEPRSSHDPDEVLAPDTPVEDRLRSADENIMEVSVVSVEEECDLELDLATTRKQSNRLGSPALKRKRKSASTATEVAVEQGQVGGIEAMSESLQMSEPSTSMQSQQKGLSSQPLRISHGDASKSRSPKRIIIDFEELETPDEQDFETVQRGTTAVCVKDQSNVMYEKDFLAALERDESFENPDADAELISEVQDNFYQTKVRRKLENLEKPAASTYGLEEELEEVLKHEIGDCICIVNFIEASVETMQDMGYLRHAIIFTAKCLICDYEFIVKKATKTWCVKCYSERQRLSQVVHSYRITIPRVYRRSSGEPAQLLLELSREIWADLSNSPIFFSIDQIMELYLEKDLKKFVPKLNHMVRFAEAVMKTRRIRVRAAKIYSMCKTTGSLTLFVDKCEFRLKHS